MRTRIASIHFKASSALKEFAEAEVQRLLKLTEDIINCEIQLSYTKEEKQAHIQISVNGAKLNATETSDDFKKSLVLAVDKLEQQLKKLKGKRRSKRAAAE